MPYFLMILAALAGGAVSGGLTWMTMEARHLIIVSGVREAERQQGVVACNARVGEIERATNAAVAAAVEEARRAAETVSATPDAPDDIKALCQRSASCRERMP